MASKKKSSGSPDIASAFYTALAILNDSTPQQIRYGVTNKGQMIVGNVGARTVVIGMFGKHAAKSRSTERHRTSYTARDAKAVAAWLNTRGVFYDNQGARLYETVVKR